MWDKVRMSQLRFFTSCISLIGAITFLPFMISVTWFSVSVLPSMASELWIVFILFAFLSRNASDCSILIAYRSI